MGAYSLRDVSRILRISPARLRYWERTALIEPSVRGQTGPVFGFRDLVCIKAVLVLLGCGIPLRRIRRSVQAIRARIPEIDQPLASLQIWLDGSDRLVISHAGAMLEPDGQLVLDFRLPAERADDVPSLEQVRQTAARPDPETALLWFERGCQLDDRSETRAEAIEAYRRALDADPQFADAHCNLGTLYYQEGQRARAQECYERALACEPLHVESNLNLAGLLEADDHDDAALRHYRAALRADPLRSDAHLAVAITCEKLGLQRRAREHWRRYLQLDPAGAWAEIARKRLRD